MLQFLQSWRERGWRVIDASTYAEVWQRYGGSVATHPGVIERLARLADIPVRYLAWEQQGELIAAVPCWGRHLALSKDVLKKTGKRGLFDMGNGGDHSAGCRAGRCAGTPAYALRVRAECCCDQHVARAA